MIFQLSVNLLENGLEGIRFFQTSKIILLKYLDDIFYGYPFLQVIDIFFMPIAYVLLNCTLGTEQEVIEQLKQIESIKEISETFGQYDILAKLETSNIEELKNGITHQIRKIDKVKGTLTLMGIDGQG